MKKILISVFLVIGCGLFAQSIDQIIVGNWEITTSYKISNNYLRSIEIDTTDYSGVTITFRKDKTGMIFDTTQQIIYTWKYANNIVYVAYPEYLSKLHMQAINVNELLVIEERSDQFNITVFKRK